MRSLAGVNWALAAPWAGSWGAELSGYGVELSGEEEDFLGWGLYHIIYFQGPTGVIIIILNYIFY